MKRSALQVVGSRALGTSTPSARFVRRSVILNRHAAKVAFKSLNRGNRYEIDIRQRVGSGNAFSRQHFSIVRAHLAEGKDVWTVPGVALKVKNPKQGWLAIARHLSATTLSPDATSAQLVHVGDRVSFTHAGRTEVGDVVDIRTDKKMATVWVDTEFLRDKKDIGLREVPLASLNLV